MSVKSSRTFVLSSSKCPPLLVVDILLGQVDIVRAAQLRRPARVGRVLAGLGLDGLAAEGRGVLLAEGGDGLLVHGGLHVPEAGLHGHDVHIGVLGRVRDLLNEHFVPVVVPKFKRIKINVKVFRCIYYHLPLLTEEPGCVHVETPGGAGALHEEAELVLLAVVHAVKVLLQHPVHVLGRGLAHAVTWDSCSTETGQN